MKPIMAKIVLQLTDIHLFANPAEIIRHCNTDDTLSAVLSQAKKDHFFKSLDAIILTGDLAQQGELEAYQRLANHITPLKCPTLWTPGNHDNLLSMKLGFHGNLPEQHHLILGCWQIILLNSLWPEHVAGQLSDIELVKLQLLLDQNAHLNTLIGLHHPYADPYDTSNNANLLDQPERFLTVLKTHAHISAIVAGHIHQDTDTFIKGYRQITTPSTCFQFREEQGKIIVDPAIPPGYRWLILHDDGTLETEARYLS